MKGESMTDGELLEKAAKAAGYVIESFRSNGGAWCHPVGEQPDENGDHPGLFAWHPRDDDGDALRLAVKCQIQVHYDEFTGCAFVRWNRGEKYDSLYGSENPCAATRLAILRAAAAMAGD
jgi:hypothetical protein